MMKLEGSLLLMGTWGFRTVHAGQRRWRCPDCNILLRRWSDNLMIQAVLDHNCPKNWFEWVAKRVLNR